MILELSAVFYREIFSIKFVQGSLKHLYRRSSPSSFMISMDIHGHPWISMDIPGQGSQGKPGVISKPGLTRQAWAYTRQACAHKASLGSQGGPGLTMQAWAHNAGLGSQCTPGLTRKAII
jgi:hypothetical protein